MAKKYNNSNSSDTQQKPEDTDVYNYLTVAHVAEKLQVSKDYVRKLVKNGYLESIKLPGGSTGTVRISMASFLSLLDKSKMSRQGTKDSSSKRKKTHKPYYGVFSV
ncbi:MAG: helix-turn-helix domain-containing protein [Sedimentisphaerales bacterium]